MTAPMTASDYAELAGKNLRRIMYDRDVTQAQISHDLKISKGTVNSWVNGKRLPRAAAMDALCRYLQCTRADIMGIDPQESPQPVQEPAKGSTDPEADRMAAVLDAAGYGHLRALFAVAKDSEQKDIDFVTEILRNIQAKKTN